MPCLANMALGAVLAITLQKTIFKKAPEYKEKIKETAQDIRHKVVSPYARSALSCTMYICSKDKRLDSALMDAPCMVSGQPNYRECLPSRQQRRKSCSY